MAPWTPWSHPAAATCAADARTTEPAILSARGWCHALLAAAWPRMDTAQRGAALTDQRCPPLLVRAHVPADDQYRHASRGTYGWAARPPYRWETRSQREGPNPRCVVTAGAAAGHDHRDETALDPHCPEALLCSLAFDDDAEVRFAAGINHGAGPSFLTMLESCGDSWARSGVAQNPACGPRLLEMLANGRGSSVRVAAISNPLIGQDHLVRAAGSKSFMERWRAAGNPACPPALLERLAEDNDWQIRSKVASHEACPPGLLDRLAEDGHPEVRAEVQRVRSLASDDSEEPTPATTAALLGLGA